MGLKTRCTFAHIANDPWIGWFAGGLAFESVHQLSDTHYWLFVAWLGAAIAVAIIDYKLKSLLASSPKLTRSLNRVASDARWWVAVGMVSLLMIAALPYIEQRRIPYAHWFGYGSSPPNLAASFVPTSLRLQFNESGARPQEIEAKNIEWTWASPLHAELKNVPAPPCPIGQLGCTNFLLGPVQSTLETTNERIIFLVFLQQLEGPKEIKVDAHGATLPKWEISSLTDRKAYIWFHGDPTRMVLDIQVVPRK